MISAMSSGVTSGVTSAWSYSVWTPSTGLLVGDVLRQLRRHDSGFDDCHAHVGQQLLSQGLGPAVDAPFGGGVDTVSSACRASGDRGDVDDVCSTLGGVVPELVEEDFCGGDGAEQVDLDHLAVVRPAGRCRTDRGA